MVPLENQVLKDHLVIKAVTPLSGIAVIAHQLKHLKATKDLPVNQEILV